MKMWCFLFSTNTKQYQFPSPLCLRYFVSELRWPHARERNLLIPSKVYERIKRKYQEYVRYIWRNDLIFDRGRHLPIQHSRSFGIVSQCIACLLIHSDPEASVVMFTKHPPHASRAVVTLKVNSETCHRSCTKHQTHWSVISIDSYPVMGWRELWFLFIHV